MVKKSALSVRISADTKRGLEKAASKDRRSVASLVDKIMADYLDAVRSGRPRKYKNPDDVMAGIPETASANIKGKALMNMMTPLGKRLRACTGADLRLMARAYEKVANNKNFDEQVLGAHLQKMIKTAKAK